MRRWHDVATCLSWAGMTRGVWCPMVGLGQLSWARWPGPAAGANSRLISERLRQPQLTQAHSHQQQQETQIWPASYSPGALSGPTDNTISPNIAPWSSVIADLSEMFLWTLEILVTLRFLCVLILSILQIVRLQGKLRHNIDNSTPIWQRVAAQI